MGYRKITNLEINHPLFLFREIFATEKIHGSSAHISFEYVEGKGWEFKIFAGGIKHNDFLFMLNSRYKLATDVLAKLTAFSQGKDVKSITIWGEGYGGKCQKMGDVYGPLNFIAFEVQKDDRWCGVEEAAYFATFLGIPFVHYEKGPATIEWLTSQRDRPSVQAQRNGMGDDKEGEGIVVRAPIELYDDNDGRLIAKYRREKFRETATAHPLTEDDVKELDDAKQIAEEWVVENRLTHVLSALVAKGHEKLTIKDTGLVIEAMVSDVSIEAAGKIAWSEAAGKAIGKRAAMLFHKRLKSGTANPIEGDA